VNVLPLALQHQCHSRNVFPPNRNAKTELRHALGDAHIETSNQVQKLTRVLTCEISLRNNLIWLVVSTYPSEKYDFVSWGDENPNIWKVIKFHGSKPPTSHILSIFG